MKPSTQSNKSNSSKSRKNKDKEKRRSQTSTTDNNHISDKNSPTKENTRLYAGIDPDSLAIYGDQCGVDQLSEEISNTLTEDINYRLRYLINDALIKARLSGRNVISSVDLEESFEDLNLDKTYGAPVQPKWLSFGKDNLYYLDNRPVNLVEMSEEEMAYIQYSKPSITKHWIPEKDETLKSYFTTVCQIIVGKDVDLRRKALANVGRNSRIGPISSWFYNFGYILISKDIAYDCLTLRAVDLITVLETSPICRVNVGEKQLRLLVRLILQRLLVSTTNTSILRPMCSVLALLCRRIPLKEFVLLKVSQKMMEVYESYTLPILMIINCLGMEGVGELLLPYLSLFLTRASQMKGFEVKYSILESFSILHKNFYVSSDVHDAFYEVFNNTLIFFVYPIQHIIVPVKEEKDFLYVKRKLMLTRRVIGTTTSKRNISISEVFQMPSEHSKLGGKLRDHVWDCKTVNQKVIVGKTSLLLSVFSRNRKSQKCQNHSLSSYNI